MYESYCVIYFYADLDFFSWESGSVSVINRFFFIYSSSLLRLRLGQMMYWGDLKRHQKDCD